MYVIDRLYVEMYERKHSFERQTINNNTITFYGFDRAVAVYLDNQSGKLYRDIVYHYVQSTIDTDLSILILYRQR